MLQYIDYILTKSLQYDLIQLRTKILITDWRNIKMNALSVRRNSLTIALLLALVMALTLGTMGALAAGHEDPNFNISVKHYVKGDEIGLTREAPVNIQVIRNGTTIAYLYMKYMDRVDATLPDGTYTFNFLDAETGDRLFSCGPYALEDDVRVQAHEQGPGRIPTCYPK